MSRQIRCPVSFLVLGLILISLPASALAAPSGPDIALPVIRVSAVPENNTTPTIARALDERVWAVWQSDVGGGEGVRGRYTSDSGASAVAAADLAVGSRSQEAGDRELESV